MTENSKVTKNEMRKAMELRDLIDRVLVDNKKSSVGTRIWANRETHEGGVKLIGLDTRFRSKEIVLGILIREIGLDKFEIVETTKTTAILKVKDI